MTFTEIFDEASNFLKLETNKAVKWCFENWQNNYKTEIITDVDEKGNIRKWKDGSDKKRAIVTFTSVIDLDGKEQRPKTFQTSSKKLCKKLEAYFNKGLTCLEITRVGEGFDTDYEIFPVDRKESQSQQIEPTDEEMSKL